MQWLSRWITLQLNQGLTSARTGLGEGRSGDFCTKKENKLRAQQVDHILAQAGINFFWQIINICIDYKYLLDKTCNKLVRKYRSPVEFLTFCPQQSINHIKLQVAIVKGETIHALV